MKNRLLNVVCGILIVASLVIIARSLILMSKKQDREPPQYEQADKPSDPLTEVGFDETLVNVGTISNDTTIYQNYILRNFGTHPLIVYHVSPDCICSNFEISKGVAMPNDSIVIRLTVDTKGKQKGMFMLNTVVRVNTKTQFYRLRLVGDIITPD